MNQELGTITGGDVPSGLRPDVATVRKDGKIDITEVLSGKQTREQMEAKYEGILGDRMGTLKTPPQD